MSDEELYDDDLEGRIANLSSALVNLHEIDPMVLSEKRKSGLAKMKRQIFDSLVLYCDGLIPEKTENENPKEV